MSETWCGSRDSSAFETEALALERNHPQDALVPEVAAIAEVNGAQ